MILALSALGKDPQTLEITGNPADFQELVDAGVTGPVRLELDVTPLDGDSHLIRGNASGTLSGECARCLEPISLGFSVDFNLILEHQTSEGIEWIEDDDQGVEDYQAHLGPDVTEVPLHGIVGEQLILNYNLHPLPELDSAGRCVLCGRVPPSAAEPKRAEGHDPRWAKLEGLKGEHPTGGAS